MDDFNPIEIIYSELYTLNAYLQNEEMVMHHDRFRRMIKALKASLVALRFTQFVLEEFNHLDGVDFEKEFKFFQCKER